MCTVMSPIFASSMNKIGKDYLDIVENEIQQEKDKWDEKGENSEIFKYILGSKDGFGSRILLLTFYNNIDVYVLFSSVKACKFFRKL